MKPWSRITTEKSWIASLMSRDSSGLPLIGTRCLRFAYPQRSWRFSTQFFANTADVASFQNCRLSPLAADEHIFSSSSISQPLANWPFCGLSCSSFAKKPAHHYNCLQLERWSADDRYLYDISQRFASFRAEWHQPDSSSPNRVNNSPCWCLQFRKLKRN